MKPHQTFLELAAMAIDYPLSASERRHLDEHLAGCQDCVRSASALRADAVAIGSLPPLTLSDRRGDLILAAALRPATGSRPLRLVAIAALLTLLITGSIAVGALLMNRRDDNLSIVVPLPTPTASPDAEPDRQPVGAAERDRRRHRWPRRHPGSRSDDRQRHGSRSSAPDRDRDRLAEGSDAAWLTPPRSCTPARRRARTSSGSVPVDPRSSRIVEALVARGRPARARARRSPDRVPSRHDRRRGDLADLARREQEPPALRRQVPAPGRRTAPGWRASRSLHRAGGDHRRRWQGPAGPRARAPTRHGRPRATGSSIASIDEQGGGVAANGRRRDRRGDGPVAGPAAGRSCPIRRGSATRAGCSSRTATSGASTSAADRPRAADDRLRDRAWVPLERPTRRLARLRMGRVHAAGSTRTPASASRRSMARASVCTARDEAIVGPAVGTRARLARADARRPRAERRPLRPGASATLSARRPWARHGPSPVSASARPARRPRRGRDRGRPGLRRRRPRLPDDR